MKIHRWIQDHNPNETIQSRIESVIYALSNNMTLDGEHFTSERELIGWVISELMSTANKIKSKGA